MNVMRLRTHNYVGPVLDDNGFGGILLQLDAISFCVCNCSAFVLHVGDTSIVKLSDISDIFMVFMICWCHQLNNISWNLLIYR